ncbi:MAG: hypothetical protein JXQ67_10790 [Campylobacterales bacterium]|nr:hypothetical protein [Campylobacterales bacterium]
MFKALENFIGNYPKTALLFFISLVYLYFMQDMFLPTTGDQKTYIAQALEMQRDGHWFMQTLFDEPDYYKGPLHFIFVKIGFFLFGTHSIFATVYMNFIGLVIASILLFKFFEGELGDRAWAFFYALSFALSIGVYSHSFASQMETELVVMYAFALYLLNKIDYDNRAILTLLLWGVIGLSGWLKSPIYSVFLSFSVLIYWFLTLQLKRRVKESMTWIGLLFGILVGLAGYIPILIYDGNAFIDTYIIRESLSKGANGVGWTTAFFPIFTYFLAPWMFASVFAYILALYALFNKNFRHLGAAEEKVVKLAVAIITPTLLFFTIHPYRGDIYALPVVSATLLIAYIFWRAYAQRFANTFVWMMRLSALVLSAVPAGIIAIALHFDELPIWWPPYLLGFAIFTLLFTPIFVFIESRRSITHGPLLLSLSFVPLLVLIGFVFSAVGKAELIGAKEYIEKEKIVEPLGDYNLYQNFWNEYGSLNVWLEHDVVGLHTKEKLIAFLQEGGSVIVEGEGRFNEFEKNIAPLYTIKDFDIYIWKRWLTHGKGPNGESMFLKYWNNGDIKTIQRDFYIVKLKES